MMKSPPLSERELKVLFSAPEQDRVRAQAMLLDQGAHALGAAWATAQGEDAAATAALAYLVKAVHKPKLKDALLALHIHDALYSMLSGGPPKKRKNAARLIGALGASQAEDALLAALERETTRFVRPSIILALGVCGTARAATVLRTLAPQADTEQDVKHAREEQDAIAAALARLAPRERHVFRMLDTLATLELRTLEGYAQVLVAEGRAMGYSLQQTSSCSARLQTRDVAPLYALRTYTEALFPLIADMPFSPDSVAEALASQRIAARLRAMHEGDGEFTYRIELRGVEHSERAPFARELSARLSDLVNAPSGYDVELRVEAKGERCALYLKLYTLEDTRFAYRKNTVPAAMHPVTAASLLRLHQSRLKPNARVLDPCCGGGTLLIERAMVSPCELSGVDIAQTAIDIAKASAEAAGVDARFIRQDMLRFVVRKPYDEVLANLPYGLRVGTHNDNQRLYALLLERLPSFLVHGGIALLVTAEKTLMNKLLGAQEHMRLLSESRIEAGGLAPSVFLLQRM